MPKKWFRLKAKERQRPEIGIQPFQNFTLFLVPRYWFEHSTNGEQQAKRNPYQELSKHGTLILPDKGERWFYADEKILKSDRQGRNSSGHLLSDFYEVKESTETKPENLTEKDVESEVSMIKGLLSLAWSMKQFSGSRRFSQVPDVVVQVIFCERVMENIQQRMNELRRVYRNKGSFTSSPKGRIHFGKSLTNLLIGKPELYCNYQEFTIQSEHYGALMTCLDRIARMKSPKNDAMRSLIEQQASRAKKLRGQFLEIPSLTDAKAISVFQSRIPPQLIHWSDIFEMAREILTGINDKQGGKAKQFPINMQTDDLWENYIVKSLLDLAYRETSVLQHPRMEPPWVEDGVWRENEEKKPDYGILDDGKEIILDAKYRDGFSDILSGSGAQMLTYATMPLIDQPPAQERYLGFIHPSHRSRRLDCRQSGERNLNPHLQIQSTAASTLFGFEVLFPNPVEINDKRSEYWMRVAQDLRAKLDRAF